jgi:autotransporter passenger strand-loop-strand repeat protein
VSSGGTATFTVISPGGSQSVIGTASSATVSSGGYEAVSSGGHAEETMIDSGGLVAIMSSGEADFATISSGGVMLVYSGGIASSATISNGGTLIVLPGGIASGTLGGTVVTANVEVLSNGMVLSASGGLVSGYIASGGGAIEEIFSGGAALSSQIDDEADEIVFSGGIASDTQVDFATEIVSSGGLAISTNLVLGGGGEQIVSSGGTASDTQVNFFTFMLVTGGTARFVAISATASAVVSGGGVLSGATVSSGGRIAVEQGGSVSGAQLSSGAFEGISGGTDNATTISGGATEDVGFGATASGDTVLNGAQQFVFSGGTVSGETVSAGGFVFVYSGGVVSGGVDAGRIVALPGATINVTTSGGGQVITSGVVIMSGNTPVLISGGHISNVNVAPFETEYVLNAGATLNGVVSSGAQAFVYAGGVISKAFIAGNDTVLGGLVSQVTVLSGGGEFVESGIASGTVIDSGGFQTVADGGIAISATAFIGGGIQYVDAGGLASGTFVQNEATAFIEDGGSGTATRIAGGGTEVVSGGGTEVGATDLDGSIFVWSSGTLSAASVSAGGSAIISSGGIANDLTIMSGSFEVVSSGGLVSDTVLSKHADLYLPWMPFSGAQPVFNGGTDQLAVTEGGLTYSQTLAGNYSSVTFSATALSGGTVITDVPCFRRGTLIATPKGDVAVENLTANDVVLTVDGKRRRAVWIGHRTIDTSRHPRPEAVYPVRVSQDAFGPGVPRRDLWLSPEHAIYFDQALIPVRCLINGVTIIREPTPTVDYFHIELAEHDVLLAEGLACESFLDAGNKDQFSNGGGVARLHPDFAVRIWEAEGRAPLIVHGAKVDAARQLLTRRAKVLQPVAAATSEIEHQTKV